jgi:hypothetical protein
LIKIGRYKPNLGGVHAGPLDTRTPVLTLLPTAPKVGVVQSAIGRIPKRPGAVLVSDVRLAQDVRDFWDSLAADPAVAELMRVRAERAQVAGNNSGATTTTAVEVPKRTAVCRTFDDDRAKTLPRAA